MPTPRPSIITPVAPSELGAEQRVRLHDDELWALDLIEGADLQPKSGADKLRDLWPPPPARADGLVVAGLLGTGLSVTMVLVSGNRPARCRCAAPVNADALAADGEVRVGGSGQQLGGVRGLRESVSTLTSVVGSLRTGRGDLPRRLLRCSLLLESLQPLVDRAEKNGKTVQDQEKVLTQIGQRAARHQPPVE